MRRILFDAFDRADHHALRLVEMADAFGAAVGIDDVDVLALADGLVRTGRFADVAVDADGMDDQGHGLKPKRPGIAEPLEGTAWTLTGLLRTGNRRRRLPRRPSRARRLP